MLPRAAIRICTKNIGRLGVSEGFPLENIPSSSLLHGQLREDARLPKKVLLNGFLNADFGEGGDNVWKRRGEFWRGNDLDDSGDFAVWLD